MANLITVYCSECSYVGKTSEDAVLFICPSCGAKTEKMGLHNIRFRHLSDKQKGVICNGCGGKGGFVKPPYAEVFKRLCDHHDFNYFLGFTFSDKAKADYQLLNAMLYEIWLGGMLSEKSFRLFKRVYLSCWTFLYYLAISVCGHKFFYFGEKEQEVPNV